MLLIPGIVGGVTARSVCVFVGGRGIWLITELRKVMLFLSPSSYPAGTPSPLFDEMAVYRSMRASMGSSS